MIDPLAPRSQVLREHYGLEAIPHHRDKPRVTGVFTVNRDNRSLGKGVGDLATVFGYKNDSRRQHAVLVPLYRGVADFCFTVIGHWFSWTGQITRRTGSESVRYRTNTGAALSFQKWAPSSLCAFEESGI
jgi:hypothetical protein